MRARQWVVGWTAFAAVAVGGGVVPAAHAAEGNTLGGTVWWDLDHDGCTCGEPRLADVNIVVTGAGDDGDLDTGDDVVHPPLTTASSGAWSLGGLPPGLYRIEVTDGVPAGLSQTYDPDDGTTDSPSTPYRADVVIPDDEDPLTIDEQDFGFAGEDTGDGTLGDFVWLDRDGDGVQDQVSPPEVPLPEFGLADVDLQVTWYGPDGVPGADDIAGTVTTEPDGFYFLAGLPYGTYSVAVEPGSLPDGVQPTFDLDGTADHTTLVSLTEGEPDRDDVDFGYRGTGSIGGQVVWDVDGNADGSNTVSPSDRGLVARTLLAFWYGPDGDPSTADDVLLVAVTAADGAFQFDGVPAGHFVVLGQPSFPGFELTFDEDGGLDAVVDIDLAAGTTHLAADFGYAGKGTIGDTVYFDDDGDGVQDPGEPGVPGQRVDLIWAGCDCEEGTADDIVISTITDTNGHYRFEHLITGDEQVTELYRVVVVGAVADTLRNTGDPDAGAPDESSTELHIGDDEVEHIEDLGQDFGYQRLGSVGGTVWLDVNRDGAQQPSEPGIVGVAVALIAPGPADTFSASAAPTAFTDASGAYRFDQLPAGPYQLVVTPPASSAATVDADGGADNVSSVSLAAGEVNLTQSFGYSGTASLTGAVFNDTDRDGLPGSGEPGVPGVNVVVVWNGPNGPVTLTATTGADGAWSLSGLPAGDYIVRLDPATVPAGFNATTPADVALVLAPGGSGSAVHGVAIQASPPVPPTTDPPTTPVPGTLPATGGSSSGPATVALFLLALGTAAVGCGRMRRRSVS